MGYMNSLQTIDGKVIDKYRIQNGNICLIIEDENKKKYSVPNDNYTYPSATITLTHLDDV